MTGAFLLLLMSKTVDVLNIFRDVAHANING